MPRRASVVAACAIVALAAPAGAQPVSTKQESDDLFGVGKPKPTEAPKCDDGSGFGCAFATDPLSEHPSPFALTTILTPERWRNLAVGDLEHDFVVTMALGSHRDGIGPFFAGATGLENRWSVEGASTEALSTNNVETRIPLAFVESVTVTAGGFSAADRASTGGTIDVALIKGGDRHEVTAEAWGSATKGQDELAGVPFSYDLVTMNLADPRSTSVTVTGRGPIARVAGAQIWYAAGIRASLRADGLTRDTQRLVDLDANGIPDLDADNVPLIDPITHDQYAEYAYRVPIMARVGAERRDHELELTALITPYRDTAWSGSPGTESTLGIRSSGAIIDGIATWRGRWARTRARVTASWHRSQYRQRPRAGPDAPRANLAQLPSTGELPEDAEIAAQCDDTAGDDAFPLIPNCPDPSPFARGGVGLLFAETADRPALTADVAHRIGNHTLTAGVSGEDGRLVTRRRYSGGFLSNPSSGFSSTIHFVEVADGPGTFPCSDDPLVTARCRTIDEASTTFRTRQLAAYVGDDWRPRADWSFTGGVRWESMELGDAFELGNEIAPRVGFASDLLGGGRSRVFAGFGRTYGVMPANLGYSVLPHPPFAVEGMLGMSTSRAFNNGSPGVAVDPELDSVFAEELTAGIQLAPRGALRFTAWTQVRWLRRGIEDEFRGEPSTNFTLTNPTDPSATRQSTMIAVELATDPRARLGLVAQYQYSISSGALAGPFDPTFGQGSTTDAYDTGADDANLVGPLPSELRHRAVIEGVARFRLGPVPVVVGLRAQLTSGRPLNAKGSGDAEAILLLPRGRAGRLGLATATNLHLGANLGRGLELVADVFNLFDHQRALSVDELYTEDPGVLPILDGEYEDLVFLKSETELDTTPVTRSRTYGRPTTRQAPLSAAIGVRARF